MWHIFPRMASLRVLASTLGGRGEGRKCPNPRSSTGTLNCFPISAFPSLILLPPPPPPPPPLLSLFAFLPFPSI
jgi:hypothetical protein